MANEINTILIRYGEIFLKGNNKAYFESMLIRNIKRAVEDIPCKFVRSQSRFFLEEFCADDADELISRLKKVCGLHSISPSVKTVTDLDKIAEIASDISPKSGKFRVTVRRADKKIKLKSMEIARDIGAVMLDNSPELVVDLFKYDFEVNVDIRENGKSYIFYDKIMCVGGLPSGCSGRSVLMLSGGIDSPVAGFQMAKRGVKLTCVHYHSFPYTSELALQKVVDLAQKLVPYVPDIELTVVPFTEIQYAIHEHCPAEYMITIMRRFMMRIAERLAKKVGAGSIITGESLGQVASQTMESINSTNSVVTIPVFRPLIGNDKEDIMTIAKNIDTYDISIRPYEDCCTVFLPKNPVIHPKLKDVIEFESRLNIDELIENAYSKIEMMDTAKIMEG